MKQRWQDAKRQILLALDLAGEYRGLGLELANGSHPNPKGWVEAHAWQVQDRTPSAGINVQDGPFLGRYHDFRNQANNCSFFDFAIRAKGGTYPEVLKHFAQKTGVTLPSDPEERTVDRLDLGDKDLPVSIQLFYPQGKPGFTARALKELGGRTANWPKGLPPDRTNHLIVFPMYGSSALIGLDPTGWHCVNQNPKLKIRQFQGKGNEEKLLDKMTVGEYGLMNVDGLSRLAEADVVNIVEGISDLGATQAVLGPWRDEATETDPRRHVVLSAGACSYHPKTEWMQHFAGKEIRIWPHVGDAKNEGKNSAAVRAAAVLPVAKAVRVPKLPLGKDGTKNDVRAWLTEPVGVEGQNGKPGGRNYANLDAYALTFPVIDPGDASAQMSPHEALLKNLGLVVIGEHEGSQKVEIYCEQTRKGQAIDDLDRLSSVRLAQFIGSDVVEEHVHEGKEPQPGKYSLRDVKIAIAGAACNKSFHGDEKIGSGVWYGATKDELLLVKAGEIGLVKGSKIERSHIPFVSGRILDISQASGDWCDFDVLERYLVEAQRDRWCQDVFEEADNLFGKWFWKQRRRR